MQILNVGLFAQEFPPNPTISNNLNIINSVTEYIAEVVLNKADAFPESHNNPSSKHHKHNHSLLYKVQQFNLINLPYSSMLSFNFRAYTKNRFYALDFNLLPTMSFDITPPPPKFTYC